MQKKLTIFQMLIVFVAVTVFVSQLAINGYYEWNAPANSLADRKKADVSDFYKSVAYKERADADTLIVHEFVNSIAQLRARNEKELSATGKLKHKESIDSLTASILRVNERRISWAQVQIDSISRRYAAAESFWLNRVGGIGLIFVFEFLAVMFGFLAPRRQKVYSVFGKPLRVEFGIAIGASFFAQIASCFITQKGLALFLADTELSWFYSVAFILLVPLYYWIGGMDIEERDKEPAMATVTTREHTESVELSRKKTMVERTEQIPIEQAKPPIEKIELKPKNWQDACRMKYAGEIHLSIREIAGQFGAKKWEVEHMLNGLKNEKRLPSPANRGIPDGILN